MDIHKLLDRVLSIRVDMFRESDRITLQRRSRTGDRVWAICDEVGNVYNREGRFEDEPSPSNRDDDFRDRTRYTLAEALEIVGLDLGQSEDWRDEVIRLVRTIETIQNDETMSWEGRYNTIFSKEFSQRIVHILRSHNISTSYYDPDMGYDDDVRAFVSAMKEIVEANIWKR